MILRSSKNEKYLLTIPLLSVIGFQLIYETVVATLALTHILPPDALVCGLGARWQKLFLARNRDATRAIQDSFKCCGFNTLLDRAFPWDGSAAQCRETFGYKKPCAGPWRKAEQINAGLLLLVAVVVFVIKVCTISEKSCLWFLELIDVTGFVNHLSSDKLVMDAPKVGPRSQKNHK